jgi:hypothetical protein
MTNLSIPREVVEQAETWIVVKEHVWEHGDGGQPTLAYLWPYEFERKTYPSFDAASAFIKAGNWPLGWVAMQIAASTSPAPAVPANVKSPTYQLSEVDIYGFAGWLTTRPGVMPVGDTCDAAPMAEAVGEYIKTFPELFTPKPAVPDAAKPESCPDKQYSQRCKNRHQCWEPCGELGHSAEHARPAPKETQDAVNAALGLAAKPETQGERWKSGNQFLPYHPDASHVNPAYRDGWNDCYAAALLSAGPARVEPDYKALYHELLFAVGNKYPDETRHQTALKYIRRAEEPKETAAQQGIGKDQAS